MRCPLTNSRTMTPLLQTAPLPETQNFALVIYSIDESLSAGIERSSWPPLKLESRQTSANFAFILNRNDCVIDTVMYWSELRRVGESKYLPVNISFDKLLEPMDVDPINFDFAAKCWGFSLVESVCTAAIR